MAPSTDKRSKKRGAPSQTGPKGKKVQLDASVPTVDKGKKRSQPVTQPVYEDVDSEDEEEEDLDEGDLDEAIEDAGEPSQIKDPNGTLDVDLTIYLSLIIFIAARASHKEQKALLDQRRASKPHSALLVEAKRAWSLARQKNLSKQERTKQINALMDIIRGKVKDIVFKHDASRIVQTAVKYGGQKERNEIAEELKGKYKELAQNKYSRVRRRLVCR